MTPLEAANAEIMRLRQENDALRDDKRWARRTDLQGFDVALCAAIQVRWRVQPQVATIIAILWRARGRAVEKGMINDQLPVKGTDRENIADKLIDTRVCHIRKALGYDAIITVWGRGYQLSEAAIAEIDALNAALVECAA